MSALPQTWRNGPTQSIAARNRFRTVLRTSPRACRTAGDQVQEERGPDDLDRAIDLQDLDSDVISKRSSNPSGPSGRTRKVPTLTVLLAESRSYRTLCERLIQFFVDYVAAAVVLLNCLALLVQLELEGRSVAWQNSFGDEGHDFQPVLPSFQRAESIFVFFFCAELLLRMAVERMAWIKDQKELVALRIGIT